jgi:hypothetical protein
MIERFMDSLPFLDANSVSARGKASTVPRAEARAGRQIGRTKRQGRFARRSDCPMVSDNP